ncbi:acetolactate synthase [Magnaporthiopsis poae ATCC 64411]|uniref:Acetolactate synthase n=1 Tax=Magnaporthiopsis poae (strain ATCC 64411 / 73-15) TaxID=644358 RepID=A0A0C4E9B9_MAGP6|nr:acetolactate synthase [Magnaporthiopsis poae ATCC 64411]
MRILRTTPLSPPLLLARVRCRQPPPVGCAAASLAPRAVLGSRHGYANKAPSVGDREHGSQQLQSIPSRTHKSSRHWAVPEPFTSKGLSSLGSTRSLSTASEASDKMYTTSFAFFEALWEAGVTHCFVNLGSDHPSIIEAMVKGAREKKGQFPKIITCPNEASGIALM